jgi:hypothetical protein
MNTIKTIDEVCGNPPGTFQAELDKFKGVPPPPKRLTNSTRTYIIELTAWEKQYNVTYSEWMTRFN